MTLKVWNKNNVMGFCTLYLFPRSSMKKSISKAIIPRHVILCILAAVLAWFCQSINICRLTVNMNIRDIKRYKWKHLVDGICESGRIHFC